MPERREIASYILTAEDRTAKAIGQAKSNLGEVGKTAARLTGIFAGLGASISAVSFVSFIRSGISASERLFELSQRLGASVEDLSKLDFAAAQSGVSIEVLVKAASILQRELGKEGVSGAGIGVVDVLAAVSRQVRATGDNFKQATILQKAFGRGGSELRELLTGDFEAVIRKAEELNLVVGQEGSEAADSFNDRLGQMTAQLDRAKKELAFGFLEAFGEFETRILNPELISGIRVLGESLGNAFKFLVEHRQEILEILAALTGLVAGGAIGKFFGPLGKIVGGTAGGLAGLAGAKVSGLGAPAAAVGPITVEEAQRRLREGEFATTLVVREEQKKRDAALDAGLGKFLDREFIKNAARDGGLKNEERRLKSEGDAHDRLLLRRFDAEEDFREEKRRLEEQTFVESLDRIGEQIKEESDLRESVFNREREMAEEHRRIIQQPFLNAIDSIQDAFSDAFVKIFSGGVSSFADLAGVIKRIFIQLVAELATLLVFRPLINAALGSFGLGGTGGTAAGAGGLGGALNAIGTGSSLSGAFGGPTLTSAFTPAINAFGAKTGLFGGSAAAAAPTFVGPPAPGLLGPATLSGTLGAAGLSALGGGLVSGLLGGNKTVGSVAGGLLGAGGFAIGAKFGSAFGPIGAAIGAVLGGLLGGLIKETPPRGVGIFDVKKGVTRLSGKKGFDPGTLRPVGGDITTAILEAGVALGVPRDRLEAIDFWIGFKEGKGFRTTVRDRFGRRSDRDFPDVNKLQTTIFRQELDQRFFRKFLDASETRAFNAALKEKTLADALKALSASLAKDRAKDRAKPPAPPAPSARDIRAQLSFLRGSEVGILERLRGISGLDVLEGQRRAQQVSEFLSPRERFEAAQRQFANIRRRALRGDPTAIQQFPEAQQQLLSLAREVFASGPRFAAIFRESNRDLQKIIDKQKDLLGGIDLSIRALSKLQVQVMREQTRELVEELQAVRREIRKIRAAA